MQNKKLEKIIGKMQCPEDFKCYKSNFKNICKIEDIGLDSFLKCLEKDVKNCPFSIYFGGVYFCKCPLRLYIAKELSK